MLHERLAWARPGGDAAGTAGAGASGRRCRTNAWRGRATPRSERWPRRSRTW